MFMSQLQTYGLGGAEGRGAASERWEYQRSTGSGH